MRSFGKHLLALAMAAAMVFTLAGCDDGGLSTDDATTCVQVELDTTYKGEFDGFLDFYSNVDASDAREQYSYQMEWAAQQYLYMYGLTDPEDTSSTLEADEMTTARAEDLFADIYAKSNYEVVSATKQDDGTFSVKLLVRPIDVIVQLDDSIEEFMDEFYTQFDNVDTDAMTDEEFVEWYTGAYADRYYEAILDLLESKIDGIDYGEEKSIVIQVQQDPEDESLFISAEDLNNLDDLILDWNL